MDARSAIDDYFYFRPLTADVTERISIVLRDGSKQIAYVSYADDKIELNPNLDPDEKAALVPVLLEVIKSYQRLCDGYYDQLCAERTTP